MVPHNQDISRKGPIIFTRTVAAQLARVPLDFLELLESEGLIQPRDLPEGESGYTPEDIGQLARIRRLHETLGLDLPAVEVVLRLREQVLLLLAQMQEMESRFTRREQELLQELNDWRRRFLVTRERR
jgi:DNA-binding transcriptional MerR regulator|uniref:MerR family transcriptional regulator n=1 Tax=Desulfobacca acetoxidans TaxID=60893 RepID=A0A7C3ZA82_9BACT